MSAIKDFIKEKKVLEKEIMDEINHFQLKHGIEVEVVVYESTKDLDIEIKYKKVKIKVEL